MKVIYPDNYINSISADEENENYPAANLLDNHIKKVWKASSNDAELTLKVKASSNTLAIFGTNATSITVSIDTGEQVEWRTGIEWRAGIEWRQPKRPMLQPL